MSVLSDRLIRRLALKKRMIEPFVDRQVRDGVESLAGEVQGQNFAYLALVKQVLDANTESAGHIGDGGALDWRTGSGTLRFLGCCV